MKLKSSLKTIPAAAVQRMVSWVAKKVGYPVRLFQRVEFRSRRRGYSGRCHGKRWFGVRVCERPSAYPTVHSRFGFSHEFRDAWDALVSITAHEIAHCNDYRENGRTNERSAEMQEDQVWQVWLVQRDALLAAWLAAPAAGELPTVVRSKPSRAVANLDRNEAALRRWKTKAKLAATKVKKYERAVRAARRRIDAATVASPAESM